MLCLESPRSSLLTHQARQDVAEVVLASERYLSGSQHVAFLLRRLGAANHHQKSDLTKRCYQLSRDNVAGSDRCVCGACERLCGYSSWMISRSLQKPGLHEQDEGLRPLRLSHLAGSPTGSRTTKRTSRPTCPPMSCGSQRRLVGSLSYACS